MIEIYIDGASQGNPGLSGAGIHVKWEDEKYNEYSIPLGVMDNHEAEFYALIKSLHICAENKAAIISVRSDSTAVVNAIEKKYAKPKYRALLDTSLQLIEEFDLFFIKWIPSKENKKADNLAKQAIHKN